ncbi:LTA synthase family protein [Pedobacter alpinus]|uniref:LTA synthase family protein n=1 Tax=Pedobacter alpinus TaxID=1590643 RepID=A0ABW5TVX0_9SPHI
MLKSLFFFIKYFLFWVVFFLIVRFFFEIWNIDKLSSFPFTEILKTFLYGILMDMSMAGYFCVIPFLISIVFWLLNKNIPLKFINIYSYILLAISAIIAVVDINIYKEWGTKFNDKAIEFLLDSPNEAIASTSSSPILASTFAILSIFVLGLFTYHLLIRKTNSISLKQKLLYKLIASFFIISFTFLAIRGSVGIAPMNPSRVYFSNQQILNISAINTNWYLISNIISQSKQKGNPYLYFTDKEAYAIKDNLYKNIKDTTIILNTAKPNIVLIIMESFTADVIEELGPEKGVTPNFSKLIKEGLLFTNILSTSDRTDKGIVAILSGFPSQAIQSIIKRNDKQAKLPAIPTDLKKIGYRTSFFYGGDLHFANFKSYLMSHSYDKIIDINNINTDEELSKWGVADDVTFNEFLKNLKTEKQPFFSTLLTLSNHEPFYLKGDYKFGKNNVSNMFRSTSYFTDEMLAKFVAEAKQEDWYKNTLFIVVADHGHRLPTEKREIYDPGRYHIPLLFFGGALKESYHNKKIEKVGNQIDFTSILLNQLNIRDTAYHYSKNLLSPQVNGFAFYSWDNGFGFMNNNKQAVSFDPIGKRVIYKNKIDTPQQEKELEKKAKALMQTVYQDYLNF